MLVAQAKKSCEDFLGEPIADERIGAITKALTAQMQNVILIGMPGSGKTTNRHETCCTAGPHIPRRRHRTRAEGRDPHSRDFPA